MVNIFILEGKEYIKIYAIFLVIMFIVSAALIFAYICILMLVYNLALRVFKL